MPKFKVTHDVKPKTTEEIQCDSYENLMNWIDKTFDIEQKNIKFKKPRIKDQNSFQKEIKEGCQVLILGQKRKKMTEEQILKEKKMMQEAEKIIEEIKLNEHEKVLKRLKEKGIKERGIEFFNTETNKPQNLGIDYAICPLYLLKWVPQFKKYCHNYQVMQKNPDGLIIEQLSSIFKEMDKGQGIVCPLEWVSAWITYCADDIQFPYPTYDMDYFLNKTFTTIKSAFDVELEKKQQEPNSRVDTASKLFGIQVLTKRTDLTKLDEDDPQPQKQIDKKVIKYFLECDLSKPQLSDIHAGIRARFAQKKLWRNFYAFDIQYKQKINSIERLPKYVFIHANRFGYPEAKEQYEKIQYNTNKKSYHTVRFGRIIDLYSHCDQNLKERLDAGRYQRHQMFYAYDMDEKYINFKKNLPYLNQMSDAEIKYMYFDQKLYNIQIFHNFFFEPIKNAKPTGQYRMIGVVLHKGQYYHNVDQTHKHNCLGQFQTIVYSRERKWIKYQGPSVEYIDVDEVFSDKYWGKQGQWTPVLFLYREIYMRNMQIEDPTQNKPKNEPEKTI